MKQVIKTFPGVEGPPIWFDIVRVGPGEYNVELPHNGQIIGYGFITPIRAEEWIVDLQDQQRECARLG